MHFDIVARAVSRASRPGGQHPARLLVSALCLLLPSAVVGAPRIEARAEKVGRKYSGVLVIQRRPALRLLTSYQDRTPYERAQSAAETLQAEALLRPAAGRIQVKREGKDWILSAGTAVLLRVTASEARAHRSNPRDLARLWARQVRSLLTLPLVTLSPGRITIPLGETRVARIGGAADGDWQVETSGGEGVVAPTVRGRQILLRGTAPGRALVTASAEGETARCEVVVRKWAGRLAEPVDAEVTGQPAPPSLQSAAATLSLRRYLLREPGADLTLLSPPRARHRLLPGQTTTLTARVRIAGGGHLPVEGLARVRVVNRRLPDVNAELLLYSNIPERITAPGTLFTSALRGDACARLFYHHVNDLRERILVAVTLTNPGDTPLSLQIVPGFTRPNADPITAGHRAGQAFLPRYRYNLGEIYILPPRSTVPLALDRLAPGETGSGIAQVRLLSGSDALCVLRVTAEPRDRSVWSWAAADHLDIWRRVLPRPATQTESSETASSPYVYPQPVRQIEAEYTVGRSWKWIRIGQEGIPTSSGDQRLQGDYGVLYRIRVTVQNPTAERRQVEVAFEPGAGPAAGIFAIEGRYVDVARAYARGERRLHMVELAPNETRSLLIETMPLGGSAYPASLVVR